MNGSDLFSLPVSDVDARRLEDCLRTSVLGDDPFLNEVASHLILAGGKRIRPALSITAAELAFVPVSDETLLGGVCVELVHLASLYHDDVMDEAVRRRSVDSVNARWGNLVAIVTGDFLLARSAEIAASLGHEVASLIASTLARLCKGQVAEVRTAYELDRSEEQYLSTISDKTASLLATACRIGGLTAGLDRARISDVTDFGEAFGMVFQIRDDVLDVIATEEEIGKPPGQDLAEGIYTLPVQRALADPAVNGHLGELLGRPLKGEDRERARALIASSDGLIEAADVGKGFAKQAAEAAGRLGDDSIAERLTQLAEDFAEDLERSAAGARSRFEQLAG